MEDVEKRFDTSSYDIDRPLPLGKNNKVIWQIKDELRGQIMKEYLGLRAKIQNCLKENNNENKKSKKYKKVNHKNRT